MTQPLKRLYRRLIFGSSVQRTRISDLRQGMHISTLEGAFATIHIALTQGLFLTHYAIHLGCADWLLGVLDALPFLCTGFAFLSPMLVRRLRSRMAVVRSFALAHRLAWLALVVLLFVDLPQPAKQALLVITLLLSNAAAVVAGNAWLAWMADLVPPAIRGSYYGRRNTALGGVALGVMLIGSYVLTRFKMMGQIEVGFAICFLTAVAAALVAARMLGRQYEPRPVLMHVRRTFRETFAEVWRIAGVPAACRFIGVWQFSLGLSAAYFGAHMVRVLNMTPFQMGLFAVVTSISALLATPYWGRMDRRFGSQTILAGAGLVISLHIIPWLASSEAFIWPVYLVGIVGGIAWAGFNLSWFNYTSSLGPSELRQHTVGVVGFVQGSAFFLGSILGGLVLSLLPATLFNIEVGDWQLVNYFLIFAISALGRLMAVYLLPHAGRPSALRCVVLLIRAMCEPATRQGRRGGRS